ncbi:hypothetical protein [Actinomadura sp. WMMB 499]|uniref:CysS/YqeB C-terminal domain-containing protein n=1 Tax=Actinomadura sp. WMMB 499 TaxID=1219491 RepID=UPI001244673A|nr:hypothetical protein [Actinomadura sp. WMMB 499]QFG24633.1 hypothetical protein F7P10_29330 [Actinomadura sp. WMMB 499]
MEATAGGDGPLIVLMGSGETTPTMAGVHRDVVARARPARAVVLDTPYGFQENAAEISARARDYFARSVGLRVDVPSGLRGSVREWDGAVGGDPDAGLAAVRAADWIFAGPGSPTYALGLWRGGPVGGALDDHARTGRAAIVFASAAACTLGAWAIPVYEIYKAGAAPHWLPGLDVLGRLGLRVAMIPHYDNAEGGTHDTRYCYLGERRLRILERALPDDAAVLGLDEHTAAVLDAGADLVRVRGRGALTVRRDGTSTTVPAGEVITLAELRALVRGESAPARPAVPSGPAAEPGTATLRETVTGCEARFDAALAGADAGALVRAVLEIEAAVARWAGDTEEDEGGTEWARDVLRSLIVRLGRAADAGLRDPREVLAPAVDALVAVRTGLRRAGEYGAADAIRDALTAAGLEVRDTPDGTGWEPAPAS